MHVVLLSAGGGVIFLLFLVGMYFLPGIIASSRGHPSAASIWVLNIFLGWTLIGWVVALAMAVGSVAEKARATGWQCPDCKHVVSPDARFCPNCGLQFGEEESAPTGTRIRRRRA